MNAEQGHQELEALYLRLEGPLQSWGDTSRWNVRDTRLEPTKSGLLGLLAACLGYPQTADGDEQVARLQRGLRLGVRVDRQGTVLRDYHTVVGGVLAADGRVKRTASSGQIETVESYRYYLADACFLAALVGHPTLLDEIEPSLRAPKWAPYLGRKCCPPSAPIYPAIPNSPSRLAVNSVEDALRRFPWLGRGSACPAFARAVIEADDPRDPWASQHRRDAVRGFTNRQFGLRYIVEKLIDVPQEGR